MVGVHPLVRLAVHIQQGFKAAIVAPAGLAEIKPAQHPPALPFRRHRSLGAQPYVTVPAAPNASGDSLLS
ncbi:hypothetical protein D3C81_2303770 [compost metagenome]